jgi:hypothetical protein
MCIMPKYVECDYEDKYFNLEVPYLFDLIICMKLGIPGNVKVSRVGFEEEAKKKGLLLYVQFIPFAIERIYATVIWLTITPFLSS